MISFISGILVLVGAYFIYGSYIEKQFEVDSQRKTPAYTKQDGVDFMPLKFRKIFLIQFLNIAGLGPIFGAISGALWGPVAFLWIVFGCIFAGAVHDYFSGMLSIRHGGASISEIVGVYLGSFAKHFMRLFSVVLLVLVGVVFVKGPAAILHEYIGVNTSSLVFCIFSYYVLATMIPIDKLIGRIYPIFGFSLLIMAGGLFFVLLFQDYTIPEISLTAFKNIHTKPEDYPIFPMLFVTIACGAISGFHATQSPLMARCITNEILGKKVFFGAMITEGIVALIWAAIAMSFFGGVQELADNMAVKGHNAAWVVNIICNTTLGKIGGILAVFGVIAAPITSGDTAFRSARLTIADALQYNQNTILKRLIITIPLFLLALVLTQIDFEIVWRYFGWSNQVLATVVLWTITMYLKQKGKHILYAIIPAAFMTAVVITYILVAPEGFKLNYNLSIALGGGVAVLLSLYVIRLKNNYK